MPDGWRVCGAFWDWEMQAVVVVVSGDSIPGTEEGCLLPLAIANITRRQETVGAKTFHSQEWRWTLRERSGSPKVFT